MKKRGFILGMHGIVFSLFLIINQIIDAKLYEFLDNVLGLTWAVELCDLIISACLYLLIYQIVYFVQKIILIYIRKDVISLKGKWYHLHIKYDLNGNPLPNGLRPGKTKIKQDLYELQFIADNHNCTLKEDGKIEWIEDDVNDTDWNSWSVDWDGKEKLVTCFKAVTQEKSDGVLPSRYGIHKMEIYNGGKKIRGEFADEYPSKSVGKIYFFRTEAELYKKMEEYMQKGISIQTK